MKDKRILIAFTAIVLLWLVFKIVLLQTEMMIAVNIKERIEEEESSPAIVNFYTQNEDEPIATYKAGKAEDCSIDRLDEMNDLSILVNRGVLGEYVVHYPCVRIEVEEEGRRRKVKFYKHGTDHLIASYCESGQGDYCSTSGLSYGNTLSVIQGDVTNTYLCVMVEVI